MFVITGGGSGIGGALAQALAERGKNVLIVGRRLAMLKEVADTSDRISLCCADVSTTEGRERIVKQIGNIELQGLVHNAGVIEPLALLGKIDENAWQKTLATNLNAPLFLSQRLLPKVKQGRVLHISSGAAHFPVAGWAAYCVSKAALSMLTRCWQLEYDKTAFADVMPGIINTDMQALIRQAEFMDADKLEFFKMLKQENRLLDPRVVAAFITWLLLDVADEEYSKEWDIYDKSHHAFWLGESDVVPEID